MAVKIIASTIVAIVLVVQMSTALPAIDKDSVINGLSVNSLEPRLDELSNVRAMSMPDEDGAMERDFINYLITKRVVKRLRNQADIDELQRQRRYWKQCAFNAVSCFGK